MTSLFFRTQHNLLFRWIFSRASIINLFVDFCVRCSIKIRLHVVFFLLETKFLSIKHQVYCLTFIPKCCFHMQRNILPKIYSINGFFFFDFWNNTLKPIQHNNRHHHITTGYKIAKNLIANSSKLMREWFAIMYF